MRRPQTSNCAILTALNPLYWSGKLGPSQGIQRSLPALLTWRLLVMTAGEASSAGLPSPIFQCSHQHILRIKGKHSLIVCGICPLTRLVAVHDENPLLFAMSVLCSIMQDINTCGSLEACIHGDDISRSTCDLQICDERRA
ncbi:hypothetical protein PAXRUDRAFT_832658 [Paxillus rubicundulus Ve08.2h10]|uniref:Uncharacterized protein n=1 Tax=Paxillus rubicundulus Ve08.2h10 TaxID=930991 RepID=A0A0D0D109_9AGAM|nr:hypothetical protein PAXRUDRAFT_832658 [Paxillus rubicundulus Ve08.2h10]